MLISRIRKSIELPAGDRRIAARMTLGFVAAILCLMLVLAGASMGLNGSLAFSQPSPSGSPSGPGGPSIVLLNPSGAYNPGAEVTQPASDPQEPYDPPKISDKSDGQDTAYHVVATVADAPPGALIEAYYQEEGFAEVTVGELTPVPGTPDTYELDWTIPDTIDAFFGTFTVRMFEPTPSGFEEVASDTQEVRMQHEQTNWITAPPEGPIAAAETVEFLWPTQGGPLGFYKGANAGAVWATVVQGSASVAQPGADQQNPTRTGSAGTSQVRIMYSTSDPGEEPVFEQCGSGNTGASGPNGSRSFAIICRLQGTDRPSQLTALAAVAMEDQSDGEELAYSQESADVHRIAPYLQRVEDLELTLSSNVTSDDADRRNAIPGSNVCVSYEVKVVDLLDRPVQGVNVDVHMRGPTDNVEFGTDASTNNNSGSSGKKKPDKTHPSSESSRDCDDTTAFDGEHADHNVPGGNDIKHIESTNGTGLSGGGTVTFGEWMFHTYSPVVGETQLTAWIDDEPIADDSVKREADDDVQGPDEAADTNFVNWIPSAITVSIDPTGATAQTGTCAKYIVRVRAGTRAIKGANVDVHATGPTNDLDFCDPEDATPRQAPDAGTGHNAEDEGEMAHAGQPPVAQHTEGVTNDQGNMIIGVTSPEPGDTTLTAWYDAGEEGFDNDELGTEPSGSATTNWIREAADSAISFLNPSPYGSAGTNVGKKQDVDAAYHLVTRVSALTDIPGVEIFYRSGSNPLVKIADAARVGQTDTWEAYWNVDVADGSYTLVARIAGTNVTTEQTVTVRNQGSALDPTVVPFETAEITAPLNGQRASFTNRKVSVRGVASSGAEGVNLFYTKASAISTPASTAWIACGSATLPGASAPQEFTIDCTLTGSDQPGLVTGIAAIANNCNPNCTASRTNHSGDAHRVFGSEAAPSLTMEPAETAAGIDECVKFVVSLTDQTGQPISGSNVDVHMTGPGNSGNFCAPEDGTGTDRRAPNDGGHVSDGNETDEGYHDDGSGRIQHTEAETTGNGRLVFGIQSATAGDTQLTVWLDDNDNDAQDQGEQSDVSVMHWETEPTCDITGTGGPDVLEGTDASEKICGFGGDDTIRGGGGNDVIGGGAGNDVMRGNAGNDAIRGGAGKDKAFGGGGEDRVFGGGGADVVAGHRSDDHLRGNRGRDRLNGGPGRDDCSGGGGRDRLRKCETGTRSFAARTRPI